MFSLFLSAKTWESGLTFKKKEKKKKIGLPEIGVRVWH